MYIFWRRSVQNLVISTRFLLFILSLRNLVMMIYLKCHCIVPLLTSITTRHIKIFYTILIKAFYTHDCFNSEAPGRSSPFAAWDRDIEKAVVLFIDTEPRNKTTRRCVTAQSRIPRPMLAYRVY